MTIEPRTILITGANRGLGLATSKVLGAHGHRLVITARDAPKVEATVAVLREEGCTAEGVVLELTSQASMREALPKLRSFGPYQVLLHNAGVLLADEKRKKTEDGCEETLQVNALAPLWLTEAMQDVLARPARIILVGSMLHEPGSRGEEVEFRMDDPHLDENYHQDRAYKNSKLAQFWIQRQWQQTWESEGLHTDVVCPGFVPSTASAHVSGGMRLMMRYLMPLMPFARSEKKAGEILAAWCERPLDEPGGRYFDGHQEGPPSDDAQDDARAAAFVSWARPLWNAQTAESS